MSENVRKSVTYIMGIERYGPREYPSCANGDFQNQ
jgi:hypothetical protein